jgi:hypothetical protein
MKFTSILNLIGLSSDPATGEDGDLYYDSEDGKLKARLKGLWVHITDNEHLKKSIAPEIFITGDASTASVSVTLQQIHAENTLKCLSASSTQIIIPDQNISDLGVASRINIVRASEGEVVIITQSPSVSFSSPSNIYLTKSGTEVKLINIGFNEWILTGEFPDLY